MTRRTSLRAAALAATAVAGAGVGAGVYAGLHDSGTTTVVQAAATGGSPAARTTGQTLSVNEIYRRASAGVVEITVTSSGSGQFPLGGGSQTAQGSGFVYDEQGHVITNQHVVDGARSVRVTFSNGASYKASVVGTDASTDLAVIKVDAPSSLLKPLSLGSSSSVAVGDGVVAIGSPFGLEESVTAGIVSALHRQITSPNDFTIPDAIQTDAALNHGNSGGPLLNMQGQVIGVAAQIKSDSGGNEGIGFAIPSDTVRPVVTQLIASGKAEHAYLGVSVGTIPAEAADALNLPRGAEVTQVRPNTPAARANLRVSSGTKQVNGQSYPTGGDVITAFDGKPVKSSDELRRLVDAKRPGDQVTLTVVRGGKTRTLQVTLATRPS